MNKPLTLALPKGRLEKKIAGYLSTQGMGFSFKDRKLVCTDETGSLEIFLVKNSDLPTYVNYSIAGLGICGNDVIYESGYRFCKLHTFKFGGSKMCLAGKPDPDISTKRKLKVATKFTRFTQDFFHNRGVSTEIIKLNGSVELAPVLGLAPYIIDIVETGTTLKANNLVILEELTDIEVHLIVNPAYYKLNTKRIDAFVDILKDT